MVDNSFLDTSIFYEDQTISNFVPKRANCRYLQVPEVEQIRNLEESVIEALNSPLNSPSLEKLFRHYQPGKTIAILVDDATRPNIHTKELLPILAKILTDYGANESDIRLVIATGTHTPPTSEQIREKILGDLYNGWKNRIWIHDCDDLENHEHLGFSSRETPIYIDKRVLSSSMIIPLSDSEYHYFAGVAGSVKLFVPGVSARKTVRVNHSKIFDLKTGFKSDCCMGNIENNVSIQDIREIVQILMDKHHQQIFVIDAIMVQGKIVDIVAGSPIAVHDNALKALSRVRNVKISEKADLVILAKPSVNFYQAGKGLNAASHAVKQGGQIVLLARCQEGFGPKDYLETMNQVKDLPNLKAMQWVIENKCTETTFEIGIQNAVDLFRILQLTDNQLYIYSELDPMLLKENFRFNSLDTTQPPQKALQSFIKGFLEEFPEGRILVFEDFNILTVYQQRVTSLLKKKNS